MGVGALTELGAQCPLQPLLCLQLRHVQLLSDLGAYDYSTWGLQSVASPWLYEDYANPYYAPVTQTTIVQQPVSVPAGIGAAAVPATIATYDYSKPIAVLEPPPEPSAMVRQDP